MGNRSTSPPKPTVFCAAEQINPWALSYQLWWPPLEFVMRDEAGDPFCRVTMSGVAIGCDGSPGLWPLSDLCCGSPVLALACLRGSAATTSPKRTLRSMQKGFNLTLLFRCESTLGTCLEQGPPRTSRFRVSSYHPYLPWAFYAP
jgi:hypothetical protein